MLGQRLHPDTNRDITYFLCEYDGGEEKVVDSTEVSEITYKSKEEFFRDITTDVFPMVLEYIKENIK